MSPASYYASSIPGCRARQPPALGCRSLLERDPDEVYRLLPDIARLVPLADVDRLHPAHLAIRRGFRVRMLGLFLRAGGPAATFYMDVQHIGTVCMHAFPLARIHGKPLHDHS